MWVLDNYNEQGYLKACEEASVSETAFSKFRNNPFFGLIVENSPLKSGLEYYDCIKKQYPWLIGYMNRFVQSDKFGSPQKYAIGNVVISPSTMRYIKTLGDLVNHFGSLDGKKIAEIGPGYGGLCKIIHDVYDPKSYRLYDQWAPGLLQQRFLREFGIYPMIASDISVPTGGMFDLCIAMYSWSELTPDHQVKYMNNVMKKSKNLYVMLNYDMEFSYNLIKENFPAESIKDYNLFYDDENKEYYPHNRFIIIKN